MVQQGRCSRRRERRAGVKAAVAVRIGVNSSCIVLETAQLGERGAGRMGGDGLD
jgi:hypothetical protein